MKRYLLIALFVLTGALALAQRQSRNPVNPYPGGSPFPPGGEPHLTHTATAYWTTKDGMTTEIQIRVDGDRATQFECWRNENGKRDFLTGDIAPICRYHILVSSEKADVREQVRNIVSEGHGGVEVRVYGFKREDFENPPVLIVSYAKDGKIVGETRLTADAIPEKLK